MYGTTRWLTASDADAASSRRPRIGLDKHRIGRPQQGPEEHALATMVVLASAAATARRRRLVLARSPSISMGPRFTYRSGDVRAGGDPVQ
jgi:hypothetical protein